MIRCLSSTCNRIQASASMSGWDWGSVKAVPLRCSDAPLKLQLHLSIVPSHFCFPFSPHEMIIYDSSFSIRPEVSNHEAFISFAQSLCCGLFNSALGDWNNVAGYKIRVLLFLALFPSIQADPNLKHPRHS